MCVCVYVCVCMCVCARVCVCECVHVCVSVHSLIGYAIRAEIALLMGWSETHVGGCGRRMHELITCVYIHMHVHAWSAVA